MYRVYLYTCQQEEMDLESRVWANQAQVSAETAGKQNVEVAEVPNNRKFQLMSFA